MAIPDKKLPLLEKFGDKLNMASFGRTRTGSIKNDICAFCGGPATEFADSISKKEYTISGSCQRCQDGLFVDDDHEEFEDL